MRRDPSDFAQGRLFDFAPTKGVGAALLSRLRASRMTVWEISGDRRREYSERL